jgi:DNA-binding CsgD family transcriptional regulator
VALENRGALPPQLCRAVLEQLGLAVFVFRGTRLDYTNAAARRLVARVRSQYNVEFIISLRDHLLALGDLFATRQDPLVSVMTAEGGEPFHLQALPLRRGVLVLTVRQPGEDLDSFRRRYRLSGREAQVAELVIRGRRNREIAVALGITSETTKKHLKRVFGKVGVRTRVQLANRLM